MRKISELTETRFRVMPYQDADGKWHHEHEEYLSNRKVKSASPEKRIIHHLIDGFCISAIIQIIHTVTSFIFKVDLISEKDIYTNTELFYSVLNWFAVYMAYFIVMEYKWQQTIGKYFTKSFVINEYAEKPDLKQVVLRTLVRMVPFDAFSFLGDTGRGWHDKWPGTYVVDKDELATIKKLVAEESTQP